MFSLCGAFVQVPRGEGRYGVFQGLVMEVIDPCPAGAERSYNVKFDQDDGVSSILVMSETQLLTVHCPGLTRRKRDRANSSDLEEEMSVGDMIQQD